MCMWDNFAVQNYRHEIAQQFRPPTLILTPHTQNRRVYCFWAKPKNSKPVDFVGGLAAFFVCLKRPSTLNASIADLNNLSIRLDGLSILLAFVLPEFLQ